MSVLAKDEAKGLGVQIRTCRISSPSPLQDRDHQSGWGGLIEIACYSYFMMHCLIQKFISENLMDFGSAKIYSPYNHKKILFSHKKMRNSNSYSFTIRILRSFLCSKKIYLFSFINNENLLIYFHYSTLISQKY